MASTDNSQTGLPEVSAEALFIQLQLEELQHLPPRERYQHGVVSDLEVAKRLHQEELEARTAYLVNECMPSSVTSAFSTGGSAHEAGNDGPSDEPTEDPRDDDDAGPSQTADAREDNKSNGDSGTGDREGSEDRGGKHSRESRGSKKPSSSSAEYAALKPSRMTTIQALVSRQLRVKTAAAMSVAEAAKTKALKAMMAVKGENQRICP